jgi:hypothetical protein
MGYNYHRAGKTVLGISLVGQKADTFSELVATEDALTTTTQISSQTAVTQPVASTVITQKMEDKQIINGYEGDYQTYHQTAINLDLVKFYSGSDNEKSVVSLNY